METTKRTKSEQAAENVRQQIAAGSDYHHQFRPTREGTCEACGRAMRVASHGFEPK